MGKIFIPKENLKIEPMLRHPLTKLLRQKTDNKMKEQKNG